MTAVPPLSRRVLTALHPTASTTGPDSAEPTPVARAFVRMEAALEAHFTAWAALDRIEAAVVTAHGYPRVPLPNRSGMPDHAADAGAIMRRLGPGPAARRLTAELRRRQATFVQAAAAAGMGMARAQEARTARELSDAASHLLLAPTEAHADLALKLTVLIAAGEATADDALTFPWRHLRALHADLVGAPIL
ncbi:hypothetical protein [Methylobacterium sp. Leaf118]|uniref:hypothetical protein n=1 Tax=Methylobacterium sp. Leaf118 TaxID=2876562 RepID=UPI001E49081E|nr:hypothetical protein [Methylobacterium sp. Leaf118]